METDRNNEKANLFQTKDEESVISNIPGGTDTNGLLLHERFHDQYQRQPGRQRESLSQFRNVPSLQTRNKSFTFIYFLIHLYTSQQSHVYFW